MLFIVSLTTDLWDIINLIPFYDKFVPKAVLESVPNSSCDMNQGKSYLSQKSCGPFLLITAYPLKLRLATALVLLCSIFRSWITI